MAASSKRCTSSVASRSADRARMATARVALIPAGFMKPALPLTPRV